MILVEQSLATALLLFAQHAPVMVNGEPGISADTTGETSAPGSDQGPLAIKANTSRAERIERTLTEEGERVLEELPSPSRSDYAIRLRVEGASGGYEIYWELFSHGRRLNVMAPPVCDRCNSSELAAHMRPVLIEAIGHLRAAEAKATLAKQVDSMTDGLDDPLRTKDAILPVVSEDSGNCTVTWRLFSEGIEVQHDLDPQTSPCASDESLKQAAATIPKALALLKLREVEDGTEKQLASRISPPSRPIDPLVERNREGYRVVFRIQEEPKQRWPEYSCDPCSGSEFLEGMEGSLQSALEIASTRDTGPTPPPPPPSDTPPTFRRLGWAGVSLAAIGSGALLAGGVMGGVGTVEGSTDGSLANRNWEPLGLGLVGVGASFLVGGTAMMIADHVACRRGSPRCRQQSAYIRRPALGARLSPRRSF